MDEVANTRTQSLKTYCVFKEYEQ